MMASALMDGLIAKKTVDSPSHIICSDVFEPSLEKARNKGIYATNSNAEVCSTPKLSAIVLAVKPNNIIDVCKDVVMAYPTPQDGKSPLILSIAAGVSIETLESNLPGFRVCRVMPNIPCLVGEATSGFSIGRYGNDNDRDIAMKIFGSVGLAREVKEVLLNAVTGLSGSGPAYVFQFIEALADGGVRVGLPRDIALAFAAQTVKGAAQMVLETGKHPGELKDGVTSPGGTTIAGVEALEQGYVEPRKSFCL
jgi:pyrroline-5-carboxylate reductase